MFITLEGGEGGGKSTLATGLSAALARLTGKAVYSTRNPGGTPDTADIRRLIVEGAAGRWDALTEAMLLYADRRHHWLTEIQPRLGAGEIVLCDRFFDSTDVYQGDGRGAEKGALTELRRLAIGVLVPDITLIIDIDPEVGLRRAIGRGGDELRYESFDMDFHRRLRAGYKRLAAEQPRCVLLDGLKTPEGLLEDALSAVSQRLLR